MNILFVRKLYVAFLQSVIHSFLYPAEAANVMLLELQELLSHEGIEGSLFPLQFNTSFSYFTLYTNLFCSSKINQKIL